MLRREVSGGMSGFLNLFARAGNRVFPPTYGKNNFPNTSGEEEDYTRPMTLAEKRRMFQKWKAQKQGTAGIPCTWMWKELDDLTLAEAIAMHRAMQSGRTWGEIQFDGLSGDDGYMRDFEYEAFFGDKDLGW